MEMKKAPVVNVGSFWDYSNLECKSAQNLADNDCNTAACVNQEVVRRFFPKKNGALDLAAILREYVDSQRDIYNFASIARRMERCGDFLQFASGVNADGSLAPHRLVGANFCRIRLCPTCEWRRFLKNSYNSSRILHHLRGVGYQFVFVTLTVRNVVGDDLKDTVSHMYSSIRRLLQRSEVCGHKGRNAGPVKGYQYTLEVTRNNNRSSDWYGTFHPHFHCIFAVLPEYFTGADYLSKGRLLELWRESCRDDGITQVDIRAIRKNRKGFDDIDSAVAEISKYCCKPSDFLDRTDPLERQEVVFDLFHALRGVRLVNRGGVIRKAFRFLKLEDEEKGDLVNLTLEDGEVFEFYQFVEFRWGMGSYNMGQPVIVSHDQLLSLVHRC